MNSDDQMGKKSELNDFAAQAIKDIYPQGPVVRDAPHVEVRKRAGQIARIVHAQACQLVAAGGDANPRAALDFIFQQFYGHFNTWSKDELVFAMCTTHTLMEMQNLDIPVFDSDASHIIKP